MLFSLCFPCSLNFLHKTIINSMHRNQLKLQLRFISTTSSNNGTTISAGQLWVEQGSSVFQHFAAYTVCHPALATLHNTGSRAGFGCTGYKLLTYLSKPNNKKWACNDLKHDNMELFQIFVLFLCYFLEISPHMEKAGGPTSPASSYSITPLRPIQ